MKRNILVAGYGYLGRQLCQLLPRDTFEITVTTRDPSQFCQPQPSLNLIPFDVTDSGSVDIDKKFDDLVYCIGFDRNQSKSRYDVYCKGIENFLSKLIHPPETFIYVSSTGVYGNANSGWVNEQTLPKPDRDSGKVCLAAENTLLGFDLDSKLTILRFAGIYGPGRIPNRQKLQAGSLELPSAGNLNLIHVFDGSNIIKHLLENACTLAGNAIFNVSDGNPVDRREFYRELAKQMRIPQPVFTEPSSNSESNRMFSNKKIANQKLLNEIEYQFAFPDYRLGLKNSLQAEK